MAQLSSIGKLKGALKLLLCAALLTLCAPLAFSQENTGSIQGVVKDINGAAVPGAKVTATSPVLVRPIEVTTDSEGQYIFPRLPVGLYAVTASQTGFKTVRKEDVNLQLGKELRLDMALEVGNVAEAVTVTGGTEAIDVTSSKAATNINERFMEVLPKGRSFNTVLQVAPGVRFEPKAGSVGGGVTGTSGNNPGGGVGGYAVNGASGSENVFIVDGVDVSNVRNAALGRESAIPFEFVREVQVKTAGFEAEFGGATGGVVNVVTKSGTDAFHGEGAVYYSGSGLNSRPRGFWQRVPSDQTKAEFFRQKEDEYNIWNPGFSLGGPIFKRYLNFFTSYFPERTRTNRTTDFTAGSRTASQKLLRHYFIGRLDSAPTEKIQLNASYLYTPIRVTGLLFGTDPRVAPPSNDLSILGGYTPANATTASLTYTPSSKLVLSARYGYKYLNDKGNTYGLPGGVYQIWQRPSVTSTGAPVVAGIPAEFLKPGGFTNISSNFQVIRDITTRHNVYLDASYITRLFGQQHTFKGGYALNRIANDVLDDYPNGRFDFYWNEGFTRGSLKDVRGTYGYYIWEDGVKHNAKVNSRNQGVYIQDAWQVHRRVTLNLGVRIEDEFLPPYTKEVNGRKIPNPIVFSWSDKVAPRFGGAWDVRGNGKWKLSAAYGHFFDVLKYELARGSFGGDYWHERVYRLDNPNINQVTKASPAALGSLIIDIDNRTIPINAQGQLEGIDPDIKPMLSREFTAASEHQLGRNRVLSIRYNRKRLVRGIEDIGTLDAEENEVYVIGNPGFGQTSDKIKSPSGDPFTPKARRDYDGVEISLDQRFTEGRLRNLSFFTSYTWSRLYGNWAGLANSDENGRSQPNVSRAFDLPEGNFDSKGHNVYGRLATDRPHTFKFFGNYDLNTRAGVTRFSLSQVAYSGTPLTSEVTVIVPVFYNGRGDLGRTPVFTQTDLLVGHSFKVTEKTQFRFDVNVINLFNQATVLSTTTRLNRNGSITFANPNDFYKGFNAPALVNPNGINPATGRNYPSPNFNPIYNLPSSYQGIRDIRLGFHFIF